MNLQERTSLVYRIINKRLFFSLFGQDYIVKSPDLDILFEAQCLYDKLIEDYKYEQWLPEDKCSHILIYNGLLKSNYKYSLTEYSKEIDDCKVNLWKAFFDSDRREAYRENIREYEKEIDTIENIAHSLDYLTLSGFAHVLQLQFLTAKTVYNLNGTLAFDYNTENFSILNTVQAEINSRMITGQQYKEIARNEPWMSYWRSSKDSVFGQNGVQLSTEQRSLILFSRMYDSIYEHNEPPSEDIINDDDALDGWLINERRERKKEQGDKNTDKLLGLNPNAQEVFIPARNLEEIRKIEDLNSAESKLIKAQRKVVINKLGQAEDKDLPDQKMVINKLIQEKFKGR